MIFKEPAKRFNHIEVADRRPKSGDASSTFRSMIDYGAVETTPEDRDRARSYVQRQPWFSDAADADQILGMLGLDGAA